MAQLEIDSFVTKFKYLLYSGLDANLKIETNAGKAWVALQVGLGHPLSPPYHFPHHPQYDRRHNGPSQQCRLEKREAARMADNETHLSEEAGEDLVNDDLAVEVDVHTNQAEEAVIQNIRINQNFHEVKDDAVEATKGSFKRNVISKNA